MISTLELADVASGRCLRRGSMCGDIWREGPSTGGVTNCFRNLNSSQMNIFGKLTITIKTCQYYANLYFKIL